MTEFGLRSPLLVPGWAAVPPAALPDFASIRAEFAVVLDRADVATRTVRSVLDGAGGTA